MAGTASAGGPGLENAPQARVASPAAASTTTPPSTTHPKYECTLEYLNNVDGHGANNDDGYQSTCDEADFGGNGQEFGPGLQTGKPCAGCVGMADDKNPPGQFPDGSDANSGYECDGRDRPFTNQQGNGNHGIGDENPAHTGCVSSTTTPPCVDDTTTTEDECNPTPPCVDDTTTTEDECNTPETCPDGSPMPPEGGNCGSNEETCPDGSPMTDVDGNGEVNPADCNKAEPVVPVVDEVPVTVVAPTTVVEFTPVVLSAEIVAETPAAAVVAPPAGAVLDVEDVRPTAVRGVQVERAAAAAAPLARTGVSSGFLASIAILLLALGTVLVRVGGRRETELSA